MTPHGDRSRGRIRSACTRSFAALAALVAAIAGTTQLAHAGCSERSDVTLVGRTLSRTIACYHAKLTRGPTASCPTITPPTCSGTLVNDAAALAYGANAPAAAKASSTTLRSQISCQRAIGRAVTSYVSTKLRGLVSGSSASTLESRARRALDRLPSRCSLLTGQDTGTGTLVPSVGPQCGAAVGPLGHLVDPVGIGNCMATLLGVWVDRNGPNPQPLRPNIVLILSDDQRWDTTDETHSNGGGPIMPGLRANVADEGVEMKNGFMTTPLCCPSRSSLLTGQYAHRHGVYSNTGVNGGADDFPDAATIATMLQAAGYRTGMVGKYLNGYGNLWTDPAPPYIPPGWDEWHAFPGAAYFNYTLIRNGVGYDHVEQAYGSAAADYSTDVLRDIAIDFVQDSVAAGEPFFLYFAPKAPHLPKEPAPRHVGKFAGLPPFRPASFNEADVSDKPSWVQALPLLSEPAMDDLRIKQLELLQALDEAIGGSTTYGITGLIPTLRNLGVLDDTIVIYMADNGYTWGEHRRQAKNIPYEEAIKTALMVRYPKLAPLPRTDDNLVLNIDLAPTLAELAGVGTPVYTDGASIVRILDGTAPSWRTDFLTEGWPASHVWATVREDRWKYTELPVTPGSPTTTFELELYDLETDPLELTNLAGDPGQATRIAAMAARLRELRPNWPLDSDVTVELPEDQD